MCFLPQLKKLFPFFFINETFAFHHFAVRVLAFLVVSLSGLFWVSEWTLTFPAHQGGTVFPSVNQGAEACGPLSTPPDTVTLLAIDALVRCHRPALEGTCFQFFPRWH